MGRASICYFDSTEELVERHRLARRVRKRAQKGEKPVEFVVRTVRFQTIANHVHAPLEAVVLNVPACDTAAPHLLPVAEKLLRDLRQNVQLHLDLFLLLTRLWELGSVKVGFDPRQQRGRNLPQFLVDLAEHLYERLASNGRGKHDELLKLFVSAHSPSLTTSDT